MPSFKTKREAERHISKRLKGFKLAVKRFQKRGLEGDKKYISFLKRITSRNFRVRKYKDVYVVEENPFKKLRRKK